MSVHCLRRPEGQCTNRQTKDWLERKGQANKRKCHLSKKNDLVVDRQVSEYSVGALSKIKH